MLKWLKHHFWSGRYCFFWWGMTLIGFGYYLVGIAQGTRSGFLYKNKKR